MADYPHYNTLPQSAESEEILLTPGRVIDVLDTGRVRGRDFSAVQPRQFRVVHEYRAMADWDTVLAHYAGEQTTAFNFTWALDDVTYTCVYLTAPQRRIYKGGGNAFVDIVVELVTSL